MSFMINAFSSKVSPPIYLTNPMAARDPTLYYGGIDEVVPVVKGPGLMDAVLFVTSLLALGPLAMRFGHRSNPSIVSKEAWFGSHGYVWPTPAARSGRGQ